MHQLTFTVSDSQTQVHSSYSFAFATDFRIYKQALIQGRHALHQKMVWESKLRIHLSTALMVHHSVDSALS